MTTLAALGAGIDLPVLEVELSVAANARTWAASGIDHPARADEWCYPPFAANLTIMALQAVVDAPLLHTAQHLRCHRRTRAGVSLTVHGRVVDRFQKRGRDYAVVEAVVVLPDGEPLWTSRATFTELTDPGTSGAGEGT